MVCGCGSTWRGVLEVGRERAVEEELGKGPLRVERQRLEELGHVAEAPQDHGVDVREARATVDALGVRHDHRQGDAVAVDQHEGRACLGRPPLGRRVPRAAPPAAVGVAARQRAETLLGEDGVRLLRAEVDDVHCAAVDDVVVSVEQGREGELSKQAV